MSKSLTQYSIFIASSGHLADERRIFRETVTRLNETFAVHRDIVFKAVGYEDTFRGRVRPQDAINADLESCDFAFFLFHNRWGSPTGNGSSSGTDEEWNVASKLYDDRKLRNMIAIFKDVPDTDNPDPQLSKVLEFREKLINERKHFFETCANANEFGRLIEKYIAKWLMSEGPSADRVLDSIPPRSENTSNQPEDNTSGPSFNYWINEAKKLLSSPIGDLGPGAAAFCSSKGLELAENDIQWAEAQELRAKSAAHLNNPGQALSIFENIEARFLGREAPDDLAWYVKSLLSKSEMLMVIGRIDDALSSYSDVASRFGLNSKTPLLSEASSALFSRAWMFEKMGSREKAVIEYSALAKQYENVDDILVKEDVSKARYNKAEILFLENKYREVVILCDEIISGLTKYEDKILKKQVALALWKKAKALYALGEKSHSLEVYDLLNRTFAKSDDDEMIEVLASALLNKGVSLASDGNVTGALSVFSEIVERFSSSDNLIVAYQVCQARFNRALALKNSGNLMESYREFDCIVDAYSHYSHMDIQDCVDGSLFNMATIKDQEKLYPEAIEKYEALINRTQGFLNLSQTHRISNAMTNMGISQWKSGDKVASFKTLTKVEDLFWGGEDIFSLSHAVRSAAARANILLEGGRFQDAIALCNKAIQRFSGATYPPIVAQLKAIEGIRVQAMKLRKDKRH